MRRLALLGMTAAAVGALSVGGLTGCGEDKGSLMPNLLPGVELTATPPAGDTTSYDIEFHWTGWDDDGEVDYFEYIIDPPLEVILDPTGFVDTLTWETTDGYSGKFTFFAPDYDTTTIDEPDRDFRNPQIGLGYHIFAIRAVDDMGARSVINDSSWVAFTAATLCPKTRMKSPPPVAAEGSYSVGQEAGLRVTFRWEGSDPDGILSDRPVYYMYKLSDVGNPGDLWREIDDRVLADTTTSWVTLDPGVTQVTLELDNGHNFGFAVRGVDEAGAVEPLLVLNRNLLWLVARDKASFPALTVSSSAFGANEWRGWYIDIEEYEVPLGSMFEFSISANADWYGGLITGYSYGWNLTDPNTTATDPSGDGAWTPWSTSTTTIQAKFDEAQDQFLYVRCKDDGSGMTLATIKFNVVTLDPDKELGYIDDWRMYLPQQYPKDFFDDPNWQLMLRGYDYGRGWDDLVWDEWDAPWGEEMPPLQFLSQFETLVWSINDNRSLGSSQKSAWYIMSRLNTMNVLAVYLGSEAATGQKGKVWAFGRGMVESSVLPHSGTACEYPFAVNVDARLDGCAIRPRDFAYDFLHIRGQFDKNEDQPSGARVDLYTDPISDRLAYAYLDDNGPAIADTSYHWHPAVDPTPYRNLPQRINADLRKPFGRTMLNFEVLEHPKPDAPSQVLFFDPWFQRETGLVPLYKFKALRSASKADGLYCGFRYITRGPTDHGEIVYFFFPMYPMDNDDSRQTAKAVLTDMFGLPDPDAVGSAAGSSPR